jgi:membrane protein implicated in regulation of membrane protease activity
LTLASAAALLCPVSWWIHLIGLIILSGIFLMSFRADRAEKTTTRQEPRSTEELNIQKI